jgi:hypothetical protein
MPYKAKDLLHLSGVSINAGAIPAATSDALHLVAYVADADGNGLYNDNDAVLITRALLNTDSGFAAYPLVDPVIVVDTDGAGFIPADAALQANEAGVGFLAPNLSTPPIPPGVHFTPIANNVDPSVSLPSDLHVGADGTVTVPVNIDNAHPEGSTGLTEGHLALTYDPYLFTVSAADVHLGSVLAAGSGWTLVPTINPVAGEIAITISSTTPIISTLGGSLVTIDFHPIDIGEPNGVNRRVPGQAPIELVASVNPSGQQVVLTELEDAQGTFTLTPAPTNGFDPRIDSVVFLTATPTAASPSNAMQVATTQEQGADAPRSPGEESHPAEVPVLATPAPSLAIPAPESIGQDQVAGPATLTDTAVLHVSAVSVHGAAASVVASSSLGTLSGAPLKDLIFQVGGLSALTGGGAAGTTAGPHLADSLIPSPVRWTNTLDTILVITVNDAIERVLADSWPRASSVADDLNWNETDWNLDWHRLAESRGTRDEGRKARGESIVNQAAAPEPLQRAPVDRAALDRYFAQTTDGTDQTMDNE